MQSEDLNSISSHTLPMPPVAQALGELIVEISEQEPDAIVIDRISGTVLVYPRGTTSRSQEVSSLEITSLLSRYEVQMLGDEIDHINILLESEPRESHLALFHYPNAIEEDACPKSLQLIPTKVLAPSFVILCCKRTSTPSTYTLRGATLRNP